MTTRNYGGQALTALSRRPRERKHHADTEPREPGGSVGPTPIQAAAVAVGALFLIVGVLGFIPGITSDYGDLTWAGHHSDAQLLGVFNVSVLHNIIHLAFGVAGLALGRTVKSARAYLIGGASCMPWCGSTDW